MKVLVATASRYGATTEIGEAIAAELREAGVEAEARPADQVMDLEGFDALVLGSAVYIGRWLDEARVLAEREREAVTRLPVWLFSSGPIGDPPKPEEDPVDVQAMTEATAAREHRVFAGRLDRGRLRFFDRAVVLALRAPEGDYRDWDAIRAWSREIAAALQSDARGSAAS